jgi:3-carboxy-cis,cis-muconate cycloisomerase
VFESIYARGAVAVELDDRAWVRALLDVEAALARALGRLGEIPESAALQIAAACRELGRHGDGELHATLERSSAEHATPVIGLVGALRDAAGEGAREHVHAGATSQDILDTALMLLLWRALVPLLDDLDAATDGLAALAAEHRATPMIARTLLQQALPTTFGLVAAGWLDGLTQARVHLHHVRDAELAVQMGGPVGGRPPAVAAAVAAELGLADPVIGWATTRVRTALSATVLGTAAGALGRIARDVTLLAQTEVGELHEGNTDPAHHPSGGSSAMAHKHNPAAAIATLACTRRAPGLVATMLAAMEQEHQRAAGAWQAEWGTLCELAALTGSAASWVRTMLDGLTVDAERMGANLAAAATGERPAPAGADELVTRALAAHEHGRARVMPVALHHRASGGGDGPPLLLGGSLGTTLAMWDPQVQALAVGRRVICFDHRGHGGSPVGDGPYAIAQLGADVIALMDRLGIGRADYVGVSIGGMVGQWLAIHAAERIGRLIVICSAPDTPHPGAFRERARLVREANSTEPIADAVVANWFTDGFAVAHPALVAAHRQMIVDTPVEGYASCCEAVAAHDLAADLGTVRTPTLVIAGAQDRAIPPSQGERIAAAIPGAHFELLDQAAHLASVERADEVNRLIADHLEDRDG